MGENNNGSGQTKADVILSKLESLSRQTSTLEARVNSVLRSAGANPAANDALIKKVTEENEKLRKDIRYVSAQLESVCATVMKALNKLSAEVAALKNGAAAGIDVDDLASRVAEKIVIPEYADVDADAIADRVAAMLPEQERVTEQHTEATIAAGDVDYSELGLAIAKSIYVPQAFAEEIDYDALAEKIAEKVPAMSVAPAGAAMAIADGASVQAEVDYDMIAQKVAEVVAAQEVISPDYIAARVAEQIIIPASAQAAEVDLDVEELSRKVADKIAIPAYEPADVAVDEDKIADAVAERLKGEEGYATPYAEATAEAEGVDEELLAENIASRLNFSLSDELIANAVVRNLAAAIDSDEIADCVAKKVGTISPEQFEITVDDDGCDSLADALERKLDYGALASAIADKVAPAFMAGVSGEEIDTEELARTLSEKLSVSANVNEDVIADKAAAILSNYMPEVDSDDIADKVIAGIIPALPATPVFDSQGIADSVSERLMEYQEESDYDIVIDEEGISRITEKISEELTRTNEEHYAKVEDEVAEVKTEYGERFDRVDGDVAEIKSMLLSGVIVAAGTSEIATAESTAEVQPVEEELLTVSDVVGVEEEEEEEPEEEAEGEELEDDEAEEDEVIGEIVDDIDESPADGEIMPDGIPGISGGVDFANMMKYNRSFIARIIQGSDEQKNYYGSVKTALLSYKKVNSNIAWGAERFNKGRETIARFKIRGKTLCLYLALDPNEFPTSVYHHADVSDNKSMHGTPMMVKIKSPRGVKKAIRLIDEMLRRRDGIKREVPERDYAAMYPYETMEELIEDGLVKDVSKK